MINSTNDIDISYRVVTTSPKGNEKTVKTLGHKIGVKQFRNIAIKNTNKSSVSTVHCVRCVDGMPDGNGEIMRLVQKGDTNTVVLPNGLYHNLDNSKED